MTDTIRDATVATRPRLRQADPLTPLAAGLHRMAAFITTHRLPTADIAFLSSGVVVDVTGEGFHVEGSAKEWARALDTRVTETLEVAEGRLFRYFEARGYTEDLVFVRVVGRQLVSEAVA